MNVLAAARRVGRGASYAGEASSLRKAYVLFMFAVVSMLAIMDRHMLSVLIAPIQKEMRVNDTMMGLLSGVAFALFYATAAIPISRYADRGNRRNILAIALAVWSLATAACGLASTYLHLLLARIGVAAGESAANPTTMSLIANIFPRERRVSAIGVVLAGSGLGLFIGSSAASLVNEHYGWRAAFVALGVPGVIVAALIWLTVSEPQRPRATEPGASGVQPSVAESLRYLLSVRTFLPLLSAKCLTNMAFYSFMTWVPSVLLRSHGMSMTQMGLIYGASFGVGGVVSSIASGLLGDHLAKRGPRWYLYICATACAVAVPAAGLVLITGQPIAVFIGILCFSVMGGLATGPSLAAGLAVVKPELHAFMTAIMYFCMNLVGAGLGPLVVGGLSDALKPVWGDNSLRYALAIVTLEFLGAVVLSIYASRSIDRDASRLG